MSRVRSFDIDQAVDQALLEFWKKGYEGTSVADLTAALGINRPSLYAAFGNKEGLFRKVVERYVSGPGGSGVARALEAQTAHAVVERLLNAYADAVDDPTRPDGCLLVQGALACSAEGEGIRGELAAKRRAGELALTRRLERAQRDGDLSADADPAELSRYVWAVCHGLAVDAAAGAGSASHADRRRIVARAMRSLAELRRANDLVSP